VPSWLHWSPAIWLVVDALATYRLTRLLVIDEISRPARAWLGQRYTGWFVYLTSCIWCMSMWVSGLVVVLLTYFAPYAWSFAASLLAFSAVAGYLGSREH
jgi:hypothetical protein